MRPENLYHKNELINWADFLHPDLDAIRFGYTETVFYIFYIFHF